MKKNEITLALLLTFISFFSFYYIYSSQYIFIDLNYALYVTAIGILMPYFLFIQTPMATYINIPYFYEFSDGIVFFLSLILIHFIYYYLIVLIIKTLCNKKLSLTIILLIALLIIFSNFFIPLNNNFISYID